MDKAGMDQQALPEQSAVQGGIRTFAIVAGGQFISLLGSALTQFAMGIWVFQETGSVTLLSMIILSATLPGILVSPLAGSVVDRADRRTVMLATDTAAGIATLLVAVLIVSGQLVLWHIFVLAVVSSLSNAFQEPAYTASVPLLVPKRHLGRAGGLVQVGNGLARIITPILAGIMVVTVGIGTVVLVDVSTFLVAVATLSVVRIPRPLPTEEGRRNKGSLISEAAAGWRYLKARSGLMALLFLFASVNFLAALVNVLYIPLILSFTSPTVLGTTLTIGGSGLLVGGVLVTSLGTPKRKVPSIMALIFFAGVVIAMTGVRPSAALIAVNGFAMMFVMPILQATSQVLWQTKVAPDVQGRVFALRRMLAQAAVPAAYLVAGPLADHVFEPLLVEGGPLADWLGSWIGVGPGRGIGLMFILLGLGSCLLATVGYLYPRIRHLETELPDMIADTAGTRSDNMDAVLSSAAANDRKHGTECVSVEADNLSSS
jgi:MFS family permease